MLRGVKSGDTSSRIPAAPAQNIHMCTHAHLEDTDRASHTDHYRVGTAFSSTHPGLTHHTSTDSPAATSCPRVGTDNSSLVQAHTHPSRIPSRHTHRCPEQEQCPSAHCHSCPHPRPLTHPTGPLPTSCSSQCTGTPHDQSVWGRNRCCPCSQHQAVTHGPASGSGTALHSLRSTPSPISWFGDTHCFCLRAGG